MNIKSAAIWQLIANITNMILGMAQLSILARLFDASQFGSIALVIVVMNICQVFSDLGMSNYIVYRQDNNKTLNSTIFYTSLMSGFMIFILMIFFSKYISVFYNKPDIEYFIDLSSVNFIIMSLFMQLQACFIKFSKIELLAKCELASKIISFLGVITLAFNNVGIEVIIWGMIINYSLKAILIFYYSDTNWLPGFYFSYKDFKLAWNYGVYQIGSQVINQFRINLDVLILGLYVSDSVLGLYSLAKQLVSKPMTILSPVISRISLNVFSKNYKQKDQFKYIVKKYHSLNVATITFVYISLTLYASFASALVYGEKNIESACFIIPLALFWGFRYTIGSLVGSLVQSSGHTKQDFNWNVMSFFAFFGGALLSAKYGAQAMSWTFVGIQIVLSNFIYMYFFRKLASISFFEFFIPVVKNYSMALVLVGFRQFLNLNIENEYISFSIFLCISMLFFIFFSQKEVKKVMSLSS